MAEDVGPWLNPSIPTRPDCWLGAQSNPARESPLCSALQSDIPPSGSSEPGLSRGAGARTRPADSHAAVDQTRPISFFAREDVASVHQHRCG